MLRLKLVRDLELSRIGVQALEHIKATNGLTSWQSKRLKYLRDKVEIGKCEIRDITPALRGQPGMLLPLQAIC